MKPYAIVALAIIIIVFLISFLLMIYMMYYSLAVIKPPEEACKAPYASSLCKTYEWMREEIKRFFALIALLLLLAFIISLLVLILEQKIWEARTYPLYRVGTHLSLSLVSQGIYTP